MCNVGAKARTWTDLRSAKPDPADRRGLNVDLVRVQLADAAVSLAREALTLLDLGDQVASHPRVGAVDHISCHPFGDATPLAQADSAAQLIGECLICLGSTEPLGPQTYLVIGRPTLQVC